MRDRHEHDDGGGKAISGWAMAFVVEEAGGMWAHCAQRREECGGRPPLG
jgi:hypothetical protein